MEKRGAAPGKGRNDTLLSVIMSTHGNINVSHADAYDDGVRAVDARLRGGQHYVRYVSDPRPGPDAGTWRTAGGVREHVSPFALTRIDPGRGAAAEIEAIHPRTGNIWTFEGDLDVVATSLWRVGRALGCRAERKLVYWAIREFIDLVRRQQAARGAC